jgi:hypothetical protein
MADADTIYRVLAVYDAETKAAEHSVGGLAIVFDHLINLMERAGHLLHSIWELDTAAESAQIAMAGLMNASQFRGADDFNTSMVMSSELMKIMRADAAALSGTYEQMQAIFQATIPVAKEAGQSLMTAEKLTGKVMEFGNTFNIPAEFIGSEFRRMMEGQASNRNALFKDLSSFMGHISGQEFNALTSPEKWEKVTAAIARFDPMFQRVGETGKAQLSTLESYWNQLVRIGTGGMFEGLKHELKEVNDWYAKHQAMVDDMVKKLGKDLGEGLMHAFTIAKDAIAFIIAHRESIKDIAEAFLVFKGFSMLGGGLGTAGSLAAGSGKLELGNVLGGGAFGMALAHLTGTTDMVNKSMMMFEGSLAALPGPIGLVAKGLLGLHSVLQLAADKIDEWHKADVNREADMQAMRDVLHHGKDAGVVVEMARQMGAFTKEGNFDRDKFAAGMFAKGITTHDKDFAFLMRSAEAGFYAVEQQDRLRRLHLSSVGSNALFGPAEPTEEERAKTLLSERVSATAHKGDTNIYLHVEQTLHDADDPDRVFISTKSAVEAALTRKSTSSRGIVLR